jgi:hypothetical protein
VCIYMWHHTNFAPLVKTTRKKRNKMTNKEKERENLIWIFLIKYDTEKAVHHYPQFPWRRFIRSFKYNSLECPKNSNYFQIIISFLAEIAFPLSLRWKMIVLGLFRWFDIIIFYLFVQGWENDDFSFSAQDYFRHEIRRTDESKSQAD